MYKPHDRARPEPEPFGPGTQTNGPAALVRWAASPASRRALPLTRTRLAARTPMKEGSWWPASEDWLAEHSSGRVTHRHSATVAIVSWDPPMRPRRWRR